jgi:hypothetical protein
MRQKAHLYLNCFREAKHYTSRKKFLGVLDMLKRNKDHQSKRNAVKAYLRQHRTVICWGLLILAAVWCLWYARPLDIYDLMGCEEPANLSVTVSRYSDLNHPGNLSLSAGEPEMDAVLERLAELRFHRNPLEVVLPFLPWNLRTSKVELEKEYQILFHAYDQLEDPVLYLNFNVTDWHWGQRERLLHLVHGQEKGRELGAFLLEMAQMER